MTVTSLGEDSDILCTRARITLPRRFPSPSSPFSLNSLAEAPCHLSFRLTSALACSISNVGTPSCVPFNSHFLMPSVTGMDTDKCLLRSPQHGVRGPKSEQANSRCCARETGGTVDPKTGSPHTDSGSDPGSVTCRWSGLRKAPYPCFPEV